MTEPLERHELANRAHETIAGFAPAGGDALALMSPAVKRATRVLAAAPLTPEADKELRRRAELLVAHGLEDAKALACIDLERIAAEGIPKVQYIFAPWLAVNDFLLLSSAPGVGKTHLAVSLAYAAASATPFLNSRALSDPLAVGYVDGESGDAELARVALSIGPPIPGMYFYSVPGFSLTNPVHAASLEREIVVRNLKLVIFDTISSTFGLRDENDAAQVAPIMGMINGWKERYRCAFAALHHLGKANSDNPGRSQMDRARGSSAFPALASVVLHAERPPGSNYMDLYCAGKARGRSQKFSARVELVQDGERVSLRSMGSPEHVETTLDAVSRMIVDLFDSNKPRWDRADVVSAVGCEGHDADTIDRALRHLVGIGRLTKPYRGVYEMPEFSAQRML